MSARVREFHHAGWNDLFIYALCYSSLDHYLIMQTIHYSVSKMDKFNIVPGFILKLWKMINDPQCDDLITWSDDGQSFIITDPPKFAQELSKYFKHNNLSSFIRQLNMYGFRKVTTIEHSGLHMGNEDLHFYHPDFIKGKPERLEGIKRKLPQKIVDTVDLRNVYKGISDIENKHNTVSKTLDELKRENELLWSELRDLREKHHQQQLYISRLMKLVFKAMEQNGIKTNMLQPGNQVNAPLMIEGSSSSTTAPFELVQDITAGATTSNNEVASSGGVGGDTLEGMIYEEDPQDQFNLQSHVEAAEYQIDSLVPSIADFTGENFEYADHDSPMGELNTP